MTLTDYRTLGRSGLIISPLSLGTMTFGAGGWGSGEAESRAVFDAYVDAGGNFVDTADVYSGGRGEEMLGGFVADRALRDRLVIATKTGFGREQGNPHGGGNGAKNVHAAVDASLRRLKTDHVDLFWAHVWDMVTPAEELIGTMGDLVRAGKIRYYGLSNFPAWYAAKMATLAAAHGMPAPIALQFEYSLIERNVENEHLPMAAEFGMAMQPWSPLGGGFLTGKYRRDDPANVAGQRAPALPDSAGEASADDGGRLSGSNPFGDSKFTERNWRILDTVRAVAEQLGRPPAQVALAWLAARPGVASVLIGASKVSQVADNVAALEVALSQEQRRMLDEASAPEPVYPYAIFSPFVNRMVFGGATVTPWRG